MYPANVTHDFRIMLEYVNVDTNVLGHSSLCGLDLLAGSLSAKFTSCIMLC